MIWLTSVDATGSYVVLNTLQRVTSVFGSERLTGALLDRLTHHVHILEMNGDSYRLATSQKRARKRSVLASSEPNIHEAESAKGGATNED